VLVLAFLASYHLRFDFAIPAKEIPSLLFQLPLVVGIQMAALQLCGVQRIVWRYIGVRDLDAFLAAAAASLVPLVTLRIAASGSTLPLGTPFSVIVLTTMLGFGGTLAARVARRLLVERTDRRHRNGAPHVSRPSVLLIGAGRAGVMAVRELQSRGGSELQVKGFVDDDPVKLGAVVYGVKVLGRTEDLPRLVRQHQIDQVIVTIADAPREALRRIAEICQQIHVQVRTIPGLYEILQGSVSISRFREVPVEQLLDRSSLHADRERGSRLVSGKVVMVSGAGGSIGSELARQVASLQPARLLLVERAEPALFQVDRELRQAHPGLEIRPLLADVGDQPRIRGLLDLFRPQVVFHAAAHKHVPMMELNPIEAVKNNVLATETFAEACGEVAVGTFVLISSDKAVRPTSVMGASKRVAELVVQDAARRHPTSYVAVRFGNVLGSAGSVVPIFREQIAQGGPVTITHPDMVRFFMTIPEAASLVLEAAAMGAGGEIFILDMGEPVRVLDLARRLIELAGHRPDDIEISFTGVRPGEKLIEELGHEVEAISKTRHPKIYIGQLQPPAGPFIQAGLARLRALAAADASEAEVRRTLQHLVPEAFFAEPAKADSRQDELVAQPAR
jgi:FlaA1/EpsC-like NDP-sugar epimerase